MMLMLERFDCKKLELAMLLDEPPYNEFEPSTSCGEPWRPEAPLVQAAMSIDLEGYAWLYVAYISDRASTWGTKQVKLVSGGTIFRKQLNSCGVWTGQFVQLAFQTVAPSIFHNIVGEPSTSAYNIISGARIQEDPETPPEDEKGDELLGREEEQIEKSEDEPVRFGPRRELGCVIAWQNQQESSQKWWIQGFDDYKSEKWWLKDFGDCRFGLTEYQRRPYVQVLMARLGFVSSVDPGTGRKKPIGLNEVCSGHLRNIVASLRVISKSETEGVYDEADERKVQEQTKRNGREANADALREAKDRNMRTQEEAMSTKKRNAGPHRSWKKL